MYIARIIFTCLTPLHCGGGNDFFLDQPVSRDGYGIWRIAGASIAGVLRSAAADICGSDNIQDMKKLFGTTEDAGGASKFWCSDAELIDFDGEVCSKKTIAGIQQEINCDFYVRDHVRIDHKTGTAARAGKFDEEIVPAGARFAVELRLDGWKEKPEADQVELFLKVCRSMLDGDVSFGGKRASGYGRIEAVEVECREFDLHSPSGMEDWLNLSEGPMFSKNDGGVKVEIPRYDIEFSESGTLSGTIKIPLITDSPLLAGGPDYGDSGADMSSIHVPFANYSKKTFEHFPAVPGSSVRGAIRHRICDIAMADALKQGKSKEDATKYASDVIDEIFGYVAGQSSKGEDARNSAGSSGKLSFADMVFKEQFKKNFTHFTQHVAIDRFTGGAVRGALFSENPIWKDDLGFELRIDIDKISPKHAFYLAHALFDLATGSLCLGGGVNRGNGKFKLNPSADIAANIRMGSHSFKSEQGKFDKAAAMSFIKILDEEASK